MGRKLIIVLGVCSLLLVASLALAYALRDQLLTRITTAYLERNPQLQCSRMPAVSLSPQLDAIQVGAVECTRSEGPVSHFKAPRGAELSLRGFSVQLVHVPEAEMNMRDRDVSNVKMGSLGAELGKVVGLSDTLIKGNLDSHDMYSNDSPRVVIDRVRMLRAGKLEATMFGFEKSTDGRWDRSYARKVEVPGAGALVSIQAFDLRVTRSRAQTSAAVYLGADPKPGAKPDIELQVRGAGLESKAPRFDVDLGT